jgi:hypothetical protein
MDGKVLKSTRGPFYPDLQRDLDSLVGLGLVDIHDLRHELDSDRRWHLSAAFAPREQASSPVCDFIRTFADEQRASDFLLELCLAITGIPKETIGQAALEDATYSDPMTAAGNVLDFDEWQRRNFSARAAEMFATVVPRSVALRPAEKLHLYMRHLQERLTS